MVTPISYTTKEEKTVEHLVADGKTRVYTAQLGAAQLVYRK